MSRFSPCSRNFSLFGRLERIIVNAGVGDGRRISTGYFAINRQTAQTNFIAALAQCEAAVAIFRKQNSGHLVAMSSMSAKRGLPKHLTTYAASKAAVAVLCEGIRAELLKTPIKVTTLFPATYAPNSTPGRSVCPLRLTKTSAASHSCALLNANP